MTDVSRFEAFVREHEDRVFATAVRLLGSRSDAEDVAQTVFLRAFERFDAIGSDPAAGGWLRTVTTNLCLNHLTRFRKRWWLFSELETDDGKTPFAETIPARETAASDEHAELEAALGALPVHQRVPIVLFHFEGRSYREIASLLGVSLAKVKTDMHRGRKALRDRLKREDAR